MIVADASALASLARVRSLGPAAEAFDLHTTALVVETLEAGSGRHGTDGDGARAALAHRDGLVVHRRDRDPFESSRVDPGQGSSAALATESSADVLLTDDLRALPELEQLAPCAVAGPPSVLSGLVHRGVLARQDARFRLETLAESAGWLGRPVYRRALGSFDAATG